MTAKTPKTEPQPTTRFRKIVTGGSLNIPPRTSAKAHFMATRESSYDVAGQFDDGVAITGRVGYTPRGYVRMHTRLVIDSQGRVTNHLN